MDYQEAYDFFRHQSWFNQVDRLEVNIFYEVYNAIVKFFSDKRLYCGGPIPNDELLTERNIRLVRNIDMDHAVQFAYKRINEVKTLARTKYSRDCDNELCMEVMSDCKIKRIPQNFVPGIFILYLELCEKVDIS